MNIKNFESKVLDTKSLNRLVGGYVDIINTPTGVIQHFIDDCGDGDEKWVWVHPETGVTYLQSSPQAFAANGDVG